jgi:hypothetical protein
VRDRYPYVCIFHRCLPVRLLVNREAGRIAMKTPKAEGYKWQVHNYALTMPLLRFVRSTRTRRMLLAENGHKQSVTFCDAIVVIGYGRIPESLTCDRFDFGIYGFLTCRSQCRTAAVCSLFLSFSLFFFRHARWIRMSSR